MTNVTVALPMSSCKILALQNHRFTYNEPMPVESCVQSICDLALRFGEDDEEDGGDGGGSMVCFSHYWWQYFSIL